MNLLNRFMTLFRFNRNDDWQETADAISNAIGVDVSGGRISDDEYSIQCYDDICDALLILSLDDDAFSDLGRIISEDIWNAANHGRNLTPYRPYGDLIPIPIESRIHQLFTDVLDHSRPWRHEDDFWTTIRSRADRLIDELGIRGRKLGGFLT